MSTHNIWFHISPLIWSFVHIVQVTLSDNGICYICIYLTVSNDSGNKIPGSHCADAYAVCIWAAPCENVSSGICGQ